MRINPRFLIVPALVAGLQAASAGDITGTITLSGTPPPEKVNEQINSVPDCAKLHSEPVKTQFYVVSPKNELRDVVVYIKNISGKPADASAPPLVMDQKGCEYAPYIAAVQTGQKITVKNSDPVMHNIHPTPTTPGNEEQNKAQLPGGADVSFTFPAAEKFVRFKCDVHPWMFAYVYVIDNPYFAVSRADGTFKIANVPPGKYTVEAVHRKANGGKPVSKEIEVKDGANQLDFTLEVPKAN
jgi:plastocyanin